MRTALLHVAMATLGLASLAGCGKKEQTGAAPAGATVVQIGGKPARFELAAEDDAGDPRKGTAAAQKLCDQKAAGVVGHLNSGTTIPASNIYHDCGRWSSSGWPM